VEYSLDETADVRLSVFDLTGRTVSTLFSYRQSAGIHTVTWDANDLSSGVYILRINADKRSDTQKVLLMR